MDCYLLFMYSQSMAKKAEKNKLVYTLTYSKVE